ncbi:hypothetical protein CEXT_668781 [Caerostris extrusa]|uniref:Uncharacterized protein n=1 Tax=Caerostris extrusa TaxID=172846 RepID=A0AAV4XAT3_CAEEX|nr:hypothetical protein CEXT_668781 [Caerostris extrusa]
MEMKPFFSSSFISIGFVISSRREECREIRMKLCRACSLSIPKCLRPALHIQRSRRNLATYLHSQYLPLMSQFHGDMGKFTQQIFAHEELPTARFHKRAFDFCQMYPWIFTQLMNTLDVAILIPNASLNTYHF